MTDFAEDVLKTENQEHHEEASSPIQRFFGNSSIFLTGGTGFLGILLLEKLLTSCPNICKIYLLIRNKKGKNAQERLDVLFDDVVFSRLKDVYPNFREKVVPVEGDCELPDFGLGCQDMTMLIEEVSIVFHVAATVRFDEALKKATFINVRAVRDLMRLAQQMKNLKSFVHVSTAYSNCIHSFVKEEIYPPSMDYKNLLKITEGLSDDLLMLLTPTLVGSYPNTYTFTKQIAEDVVAQEGKGLPIGVHRPAVVTPTAKEPLRGWINNFYGPTGYAAGCAVGLIRVGHCDPEKKSNLVPGDLTVNSIIASAWDIAKRFHERTSVEAMVPVYTFEAGDAAKITWGDFARVCKSYGHRFCTVKTMWYMFGIITRFRLAYVVLSFFLHTLPAILVDMVLFCLGKRPMMLKVYKKVHKMLEVSKYFLLREWTFESGNMRSLIDRMSPQDQKTFFCEMRDFDWREYVESYIIGIRVYLFKDPLETVPEAQRRRRRLYWIHQLTKIVAVTFSFWILKCLFY